MIVKRNAHLNNKADKFSFYRLDLFKVKNCNSTEPDNLHLLDNRHLLQKKLFR